MNKIILGISTFVVAGAFAAGVAHASYYGATTCQPIYGGGETCATTDKVVLDKKVMTSTQTKGGAEAYVDNLSSNDKRFQAGETVKFQLTVTNPTKSKLDKVVVTDTLPSYIEFVSGPGNYDQNTKTLRFEVLNLNTNESRKFVIEAKVVSADKLPGGQGITCVVNQAMAEVSGSQSKDNSQFCIEKVVSTTKGGQPVMDTPKGLTKTPATGPEMLALVGLLPAAGAGMYLRRKASK